MSISFSIGDVLRYFLERKNGEKERIAIFLESVARDARLLADIWKEVWDKVKQRIVDIEMESSQDHQVILFEKNPDAEKIIKEQLDRFDFHNGTFSIFSPQIEDTDTNEVIFLKKIAILNAYGLDESGNIRSYSRLVAFYKLLRDEFEDKFDSRLGDQILIHLKNILNTRQITKRTLDDIVPILKESKYLDDRNKQIRVHRLSELIEVLQREAAAIEIIAEKYRALI